MFGVDHAVKVAQVMEFDLSILYTNEGAALTAFLALIDQIFQAHARQARGLNAVKGRGVTALLQVAEDGGAYIEYILSSLRTGNI
jgi:hypothetical protein